MRCFVLFQLDSVHVFLKDSRGDEAWRREMTIPLHGKLPELGLADDRVWLVGEWAGEYQGDSTDISFSDKGTDQASNDIKKQALLVGVISEIADRLKSELSWQVLDQTLFCVDDGIFDGNSDKLKYEKLSLSDHSGLGLVFGFRGSVPPFWLGYALGRTEWPGQPAIIGVSHKVFDDLGKDISELDDSHLSVVFDAAFQAESVNGMISLQPRLEGEQILVHLKETTGRLVINDNTVYPTQAVCDLDFHGELDESLAVKLKVDSEEKKTGYKVLIGTGDRALQPLAHVKIVALDKVTARLRIDEWGRVWLAISDPAGDFAVFNKAPRRTELLVASLRYDELVGSKIDEDLGETVDCYLDSLSFNGRAPLGPRQQLKTLELTTSDKGSTDLIAVCEGNLETDLDSESPENSEKMFFDDLFVAARLLRIDGSTDEEPDDEMQEDEEEIGPDVLANKRKLFLILEFLAPRRDAQFRYFVRRLVAQATSQSQSP